MGQDEEATPLMACKVVVNRHGFVAFRLYWNGMESWEGTGLSDTAKNHRRVEARAVLITVSSFFFNETNLKN